LRKSAQIGRLEAEHGKPLAQIVAEAYTTHQGVHAAAKALGVNPNTFGYWLVRLTDVQTRKVATPANGKVLT
jgi:transposase-like protein